MSHRTNGHAKGSMSHRITNILSDDYEELPMYKDKPHYPPSRRKKMYQRRGPQVAIALLLLSFLYYTGYLPSGRSPRPPHTHHHYHHGTPSKDPALWAARADEVRSVFKTTWAGYEKYAWGLDEYHPISKSGRNMVEGGMGWIIVDALDTAILMNLTTEVSRAREWIRTSLHYTADHDVNTFETTIRMLGGLLSAHWLSTTYPHLAPQTDDDVLQPGEDLYIEKATHLADRLLGAFDTPSGIPLASINLNTSLGIPAGDGLSSTAEAATLQLEFKHLSKITGESVYWETSEKVIKVIDDLQPEGGLVPIFMSPQTGTFRGQNIRLGSRGDSYYEYLLKQWLQFRGSEPVYREMWDEVLDGIKRYLVTWTKHGNMTIIGERQNGLNHELTPKMDHLVAFMPGTIALGLTNGTTVEEAKQKGMWTRHQEADLAFAKELMKSFWAMYKGTATGLAPEIAYFHVDSPPRQWSFEEGWTLPQSNTDDFDDVAESTSSSATTSTSAHDHDHDHDTNSHPWKQDLDLHTQDLHNLLRPETVESLFYMYHITQDPIYREWGYEMFQSFVEHAAVRDDITGEVYAYASLDTVDSLDSNGKIRDRDRRDNMESFWPAETLKYFFLLFSELGGEGVAAASSGSVVSGKASSSNVMPFRLEDVVFNTEAHPLPRFDISTSTIWKTGWQRKPRTASPAAAAPGATGEEQVPVGLGVPSSPIDAAVVADGIRKKLADSKDSFEIKHGKIGLDDKVLDERAAASEALGRHQEALAATATVAATMAAGDAEWEDKSWTDGRDVDHPMGTPHEGEPKKVEVQRGGKTERGGGTGQKEGEKIADRDAI
ncbi:Mannosyl-oligosaccharide 1,2-alpha-mannosidase [Cyphellophora attinorum]|uniref:alpha-1,2-Mannosidase n=1 Tax=Cyphellophora attinorum TaxID=1664694 RepID=A0A0N1HC50_9EURO|nr:Mannosyl-oligosaccharide 1,2-alpha-mannosidase [Phialophora attinorum]KPI45935.1 Mannosyl-oligosaccharide 1,2-alpha-mannosidase [Phialophora attinorum]